MVERVRGVFILLSKIGYIRAGQKKSWQICEMESDSLLEKNHGFFITNYQYIHTFIEAPKLGFSVTMPKLNYYNIIMA